MARAKKTKRRVKKPIIGIFSLTACEGCQFALLDLGEKFFNFLKKIELIDFSLIEDEPFPKGKVKIDIAFVEGTPITSENVRLLKKIREESKLLVVIGNCAALGGINKIKNYQGKEKTLRYIYKQAGAIENPEIRGVDHFVKVDLTIPGCPINGEEFLRLVEELLKGKIPKIPEKPVCTECSHQGKETCFLRKKQPCFGTITLAGCGAVCPAAEFPCYGCRGTLKNINPAGFLGILKKMRSAEEINANLEIFGIKDELEKFL